MIIGLSALVGNPGLRRWRHQPIWPINAGLSVLGPERTYRRRLEYVRLERQRPIRRIACEYGTEL